MTEIDWTKCPAVERTPDIMSGAWVLRGTRMPVSGVLENVEAGATVDDIVEWFDGLKRAQVEEVIAFMAHSQHQTVAFTR
jgi:uncharacterized protein (DUF433 family)